MSGTEWGIALALGIMLCGTIIASVLIWQIFRTLQISIQSDGGASRDRLWRALVGPADRSEDPRCNGRVGARSAMEGEQ